MRNSFDKEEHAIPEDKKTLAHVAITEKVSSASCSEVSLPLQSPLEPMASQIAILPQYMTQNPTTITIREVDIPKFSGFFTVTLQDGREIFQIVRERPSFSHRHHIIDPNINATVLTTRRDIGKLPVSYQIQDDCKNQIVDLQGNFYVPLQGARATAVFFNAVDQRSMQLSMYGSWRNRNAEIKNSTTGEVVATMQSEFWNARNLLGSRRTYVISVCVGVDLALVTAMVICLDARSS